MIIDHAYIARWQEQCKQQLDRELLRTKSTWDVPPNPLLSINNMQLMKSLVAIMNGE